jgi:hypothetical protein
MKLFNLVTLLTDHPPEFPPLRLRVLNLRRNKPNSMVVLEFLLTAQLAVEWLREVVRAGFLKTHEEDS